MSKHYIVNKNDKYQLKVRVKRNNISGEFYPLKITIVTEFAGDVFEEELDNTNLSTSYEERTYEFNVDFRSSSLTIRIEGRTNYGSASIDYAYLSIYRQQFQTTVLTQLVLEGSDMDSLTGWTTTGNVFMGVSGNEIIIQREGKIEKTITFKNYSINTVLLQNGIVDYYSLTRSYTDINSITSNILYNYYSINNFIFVYPSELLFLIDGNTANNFDFNESSITPTNTILGQSPQQITVIGKWLPSATTTPISVIATDVTNATNKYTFLNLDIQKANQDSFDLSGVLSSYPYSTDITFDSSGGTGTGTVNYTVIHPIFGSITVLGDTITQDISANIEPYTVVGTKLGDENYNDISASELFTVQKANQDSFDLSGVLSSYPYSTDITFDSSGGTGTGTVNYTVIHPIFGSITVLGDTITQDINANIEPYTVVGTKIGDENYNDISASELFTVQKTNQHKSPVENFLLEIIAVEQLNEDLQPNVVNVLINEVIVGSNDVIVGSLDFTEDLVWKKFTFNVSLDITSTEMEIKIQNIRKDARGTFIDSVKLFYQDPINGDKQLIANPGMFVYNIPATNPDNQNDPNWNPNFLFLDWNTQYGSWFMGPATGQVKNYSQTSNYTGTNDGDGNHIYFTQYGYFKQTLTFTRNITYDNINNKYDISTTVTNTSISYPDNVSTTITTGTFNYDLPVVDQSPQISLFTSTLMEKYRLSFQARARTDSNGIGAGNTTDIYYSLSNAFVISVPTSVILDTITPSNSVWTEYVYIISLPPVFDYFSIRFQNTQIGQFSNCFTDIKLEAYIPNTETNTNINVISDSQTQLGTSGLPVGTWNVLLSFFNYDSWYTVGVRHEHNSIQEKVTRNTETFAIVGGGYLIQELLVSRTFDYVSNTITTTFKNKNTNAITNSYSYSHVPEYQYDNRPETTYVLSSGGSGSGAISYSGDLTVTNNTLESLSLKDGGTYTISALKDGGDYYNDSSTNFNVVISPVSQDPPISVTGVDISYNYGVPVSFAYSGGSGTGDLTITLNGLSTLNGNIITSPIENLDANNYDLVVTKGATVNYFSSSFTTSFTVNKIDQQALTIANIANSYPYLTPIVFSISGGSSTGDTFISLYEEQSENNYVLILDGISSPLENVLVGSYRLECTKLGDVNYQDISTFVDFSVTKINQTTPLTIESESNTNIFYYSQTSLTAIVSGGNGDGEIILSFDPPSVEITGNTVSLFTDVGFYDISATKTADRNYNSAQSEIFSFQIQSVSQETLVLENNNTTYIYNPELSIDFNIQISGGSGTGAISVESNGILLENNTLNTPNVDTYNITVIKQGDENYPQASVDGTIYVTKAEQGEIIFNNIDTYVYGNDINLSAYPTTVTNGVFTFSYNGATIENLTGFDVGTYTIVALNTGGINYFDISGEKTIAIIKADQSDNFEITTSNLFTYDPSLRIIFDASGGSGNGTIQYDLKSDFNQDGNETFRFDLEYIDGAEVGIYTLYAIRDGGINYHPKTVFEIFTVVQADQADLYNLNEVSYVYDPNQRIYFDVSGGSTDNPIAYRYYSDAIDPSYVILDTPNDKREFINNFPGFDDSTLSSNTCWAALYNSVFDTWLTIGNETDDNISIVGVIIKPRGSGAIQYVTKFTAEYSSDNINFYSVDNGFEFSTNFTNSPPFDFNQESLIFFATPVYAQYIRITPTVAEIWISMRADLIKSNLTASQEYLDSPEVGDYSITATKDGNRNYKQIIYNYNIEITKADQLPLVIIPDTVYYLLEENGQVQLDISGGSTESTLQLEFTSEFLTIDDNNLVTYNRPGTNTIAALKEGNKNYKDLYTIFTFEVIINIQVLRENGFRPRELVDNQYITLEDIKDSYSVLELANNAIENIHTPDRINGITVREMFLGGISACAIFGTRLFTVLDLKRAGFKMRICVRS